MLWLVLATPFAAAHFTGLAHNGKCFRDGVCMRIPAEGKAEAAERSADWRRSTEALICRTAFAIKRVGEGRPG
jgi:hypothetical protein